MSLAHLGAGSKEPPKVKGLLRLYSMEYCPYAQRVRLVLNAKKIKHDTVNINLTTKPEWFLKIHSEGKVPVIDTGSEVVIESLDISDYLDEKYPNPPLYPKDPAAKKRDKELIEKFSPLTGVFYKLVLDAKQKTPEEWAKELEPLLNVFENELAKRGTLYFGGDTPGMVDYMIWPWAERSPLITKYIVKLPFGPNHIPLLKKWRSALKEYPAAKEIYHDPETYKKFFESRVNGTPKYDNL